MRTISRRKLHRSSLRSLALASLICALGMDTIGCAPTPSQDLGVPRTVVVVDGSGSFSKYLENASSIVRQMLGNQMDSGEGEIYVVSMDRTPEVKHKFDADQPLRKNDHAVVAALTNVSSQDGTDVVKALQIATHYLYHDSGTPVSKRTLIVFSDMSADRGTNPIVRFPDIDKFDWQALSKADMVRFFFVSDDNVDHVSSLLAQGGCKDARAYSAVDSSKAANEVAQN